ncbi:MAG: hypothetical protein AAFQ35_03830, partial [Pseudomonadota bacterium]
GASGADQFEFIVFTEVTNPQMAVVKSSTVNVGSNGRVDAGDTITYTYTVRNTGNVTLFDVAVAENSGTFTGTFSQLTTPTRTAGGANIDGDGDAFDLAVGSGTMTFQSTYTIQQADIDAGPLTNQATASATVETQSGGATINDNSDESGFGAGDNDPTVTPLPPVPLLTITKLADDDTERGAGEEITYTYRVQNSGNVTISNVQISDAHNGSDPPPTPQNETLVTDNAPANDSTDAAANGVWDSLAPGDAVRFTGTYDVTQIDVDLRQ